MAAQFPSESPRAASPLFLREPEIRRGIELLYFGYSHLYRGIDEGLADKGLGRAHHRSLYFILSIYEMMCRSDRRSRTTTNPNPASMIIASRP